MATKNNYSIKFQHIYTITKHLPGIEKSRSYGTPALKVKGKLFARMHQEYDALVLRMNVVDRDVLILSAPDVFYVTDHYRDHPWVLVNLSLIQRKTLAELLERAWRLVASKTLLKQMD